MASKSNEAGGGTGPLAGKRALVCGSTQGIGRACAFEFARLGADVVLAARDEASLLETVDAISAASPRGGTHRHIRVDFGDPTDVRQRVEEHLAVFG